MMVLKLATPLLPESGCDATPSKTSENGILISDDSESLYEGLKVFHENREKYNSELIRKKALKFQWEKIVSDLNCHIGEII